MKRMSLKKLKELGLKSLNHPLHNPDTDLGDTFYEEEAKRHNYVLYAENVPEPLDCQGRRRMSRNHRFKMSTFSRQWCPVGFVKLPVVPPFLPSPETARVAQLCAFL